MNCNIFTQSNSRQHYKITIHATTMSNLKSNAEQDAKNMYHMVPYEVQKYSVFPDSYNKSRKKLFWKNENMKVCFYF